MPVDAERLARIEEAAADPAWIDRAAALPDGHTIVEGVEDVGPLWTDPQPLDNPLPPVPVFDPDLLPPDLVGWVIDVAERLSVPPELVAAGAMSALSVVVCNVRTIRPKRFDTWTLFPVLWGCAIASPGAKKSPALKAAHAPLVRLEERAREAWNAQNKARQAAELVAKSKAKAAQSKLEQAARKGEPDDDLRALAAEAQAGSDVAETRCRRYLSNDSTIETITDLVRWRGDDHRSAPLLMQCDELIGLMRTFERDGREGDRAFYLEGWSVTNRAVDRQKRGSSYVRDLCLIVYGNATPGPFAEYVREATSGSDADGFLQRLQLLVYPDHVADPVYVDRAPIVAAERRAFAVFDRLAGIDQSDDDGRPPALQFDGEAQAFYDDWAQALELRLARTDDHPALLSHLSKYRGLMPSLALVCHVASGAGCEDQPVGIASARRAAAWCVFLEAHARRVYSIAESPMSAVIGQIAHKVRAGKLAGELTARRVHRALPDKTSAELVHDALELLEERGWCRLLTVGPSRNGGRPSVRVDFNPRARAA